MNLNISHWKPFLLKDLFNIQYGSNLELNTCTESNDEYAINFVSRTEINNGISAKVAKMENIKPQKSGLISVAAGGSVLSSFYQSEPFYSGRDLYTLEAKYNISEYAKFFIITLIEANKFRYSYGRHSK
ncbi:restriction endonuclease subunit S [Caviibacterium pharyngocola]|uniref:Restriction endonuclease subunit S n=1 Tax=Caviibacterium pharyngocola TaxID=28159 RepID=A0A2M8RU37_9PAST|nr:restriction endonuclease subunit S [Caviibacterium pharyngocola]PJG82399.1 restriction endonuclease subunit S [Caviibacterium pharyngocola]